RDANAQLLSLWWDVYTPADIWLQHGAAAVRNIPRGQWFSVRRLAQALIEAGVTTSGRCDAEAEQSLFSYWLKPMAAFGLMELGMLPDGPAARLLPYEEDEEEKLWYVQPDFEIIVPPAAPLLARWDLEACAEYCAGD